MKEAIDLKIILDQFNQTSIFENILKDFTPYQTRLDGIGYSHKIAKDLTAIVSFSRESDDQIWKHVSVARQKRMPTYAEIEDYKTIFCGEDTYALIVFPPKDKWVSIHPYCIHFWEPMEKYPLPEFSGFIGKSRTI